MNKKKIIRPKGSCGKKGCSVRTIVLPYMGLRHKQIRFATQLTQVRVHE